ncbi:hypothetical protein NPIL_38341 [Nephila pilipes]|uniref:Uncharacterized protein n=1 Tax=Nephila pilipes TaxID=299642 RepID=A0A8X6T1Y8_NEPPI|nr:hypothetical protein NPIL_38341 [Nephila pilipes]
MPLSMAVYMPQFSPLLLWYACTDKKCSLTLLAGCLALMSEGWGGWHFAYSNMVFQIYAAIFHNFSAFYFTCIRKLPNFGTVIGNGTGWLNGVLTFAAAAFGINNGRLVTTFYVSGAFLATAEFQKCATAVHKCMQYITAISKATTVLVRFQSHKFLSRQGYNKKQKNN